MQWNQQKDLLYRTELYELRVKFGAFLISTYL